MPYKTESDLHRMLRHQELIDSSLSFVSGFEDFIREFDGVLKNEYAGCDGGVSLTCERTALESALSPEDTRRLLRTLLVHRRRGRL